jgi:hypothetical protein
MKKSISLKDKRELTDIVKGLLLYGSPLPCKRHHALYTYITKPRSYTYKNHYRTLGGKSICLHARKETSDIEQTSDIL